MRRKQAAGGAAAAGGATAAHARGVEYARAWLAQRAARHERMAGVVAAAASRR